MARPAAGIRAPADRESHRRGKQTRDKGPERETGAGRAAARNRPCSDCSPASRQHRTRSGPRSCGRTTRTRRRRCEKRPGKAARPPLAGLAAQRHRVLCFPALSERRRAGRPDDPLRNRPLRGRISGAAGRTRPYAARPTPKQAKGAFGRRNGTQSGPEIAFGTGVGRAGPAGGDRRPGASAQGRNRRGSGTNSAGRLPQPARPKTDGGAILGVPKRDPEAGFGAMWAGRRPASKSGAKAKHF